MSWYGSAAVCFTELRRHMNAEGDIDGEVKSFVWCS